ncbi:MAG TPA: PQQ-dependent sugar dehydrogenase, partial [Stellaceae bacterium]
MPDRTRRPRNAALILAAAAAFGAAVIARADPAILTGAAAFGDWTRDAPGTRRHITAADLPAPHATRSASNPAQIVPRPKGAMPHAPPGFTVSQFASGLAAPRLLRVAPSGDIFVAETDEGEIRVLQAGAKGAQAAQTVYAKDLDGPFGLAFYPPGADPQYLYVATATAVLRFPYRRGDCAARGKPEMIGAKLPTGGHTTRDVLFSADGKKMYVAVGSESNAQEGSSADETRRANILELNPDGSGERRFATGLRNPVEMALNPLTGELWTVVNERDGLGDDLPPDYLTRV